MKSIQLTFLILIFPLLLAAQMREYHFHDQMGIHPSSIMTNYDDIIINNAYRSYYRINENLKRELIHEFSGAYTIEKLLKKSETDFEFRMSFLIGDVLTPGDAYFKHTADEDKFGFQFYDWELGPHYSAVQFDNGYNIAAVSNLLYLSFHEPNGWIDLLKGYPVDHENNQLWIKNDSTVFVVNQDGISEFTFFPSDLNKTEMKVLHEIPLQFIGSEFGTFGSKNTPYENTFTILNNGVFYLFSEDFSEIIDEFPVAENDIVDYHYNGDSLFILNKNDSENYQVQLYTNGTSSLLFELSDYYNQLMTFENIYEENGRLLIGGVQGNGVSSYVVELNYSDNSIPKRYNLEISDANYEVYKKEENTTIKYYYNLYYTVHNTSNDTLYTYSVASNKYASINFPMYGMTTDSLLLPGESRSFSYSHFTIQGHPLETPQFIDRLYVTGANEGLMATAEGTEVVFSDITSTKSIENSAAHIFPNPVSNQFSVDGLSGDVAYDIFNAKGEKVSSGTLLKNDNLTVQSLLPGTYFFKYTDGTELNVIQFVKID